jgi:hypothetical protein
MPPRELPLSKRVAPYNVEKSCAVPREILSTWVDEAARTEARIVELEAEIERDTGDWCKLMQAIAEVDSQHDQHYAMPPDADDSLFRMQYDPWDALRRIKAEIERLEAEQERRFDITKGIVEEREHMRERAEKAEKERDEALAAVVHMISSGLGGPPVMRQIWAEKYAHLLKPAAIASTGEGSNKATGGT